MEVLNFIVCIIYIQLGWNPNLKHMFVTIFSKTIFEHGTKNKVIIS